MSRHESNVEQLLDWAEAEIKRSRAVDLWRASDARVNAEDLLGDILGKELRVRHLDERVSRADENKFRKMVDRRVAGEPVAFILGYTIFRNLKMKVSPGVFVPRNSSELLATEAVRKVRPRKAPVVVDVATGTGPVALAVANESKNSQVYGIDIWAPSIAVAKTNARALKLGNVKFLESDMLGSLPPKLKGKVDAFTIHPPYVARRHVRTLPKEIRDYEPKVSLSDNSEDGLGLVRRLVDDAPEWLGPRGWLLVEISPDLARRVGTILRHGGFGHVKSKKDSLGATRVVSGRI
ncbi:MAG TPA: peptide chain release factor N(5)-glutamine methyltransferase [Actinomycetota bacterium]|nr:peptide chain release factor N(5)-glutamine methyltransferase [Actinomycetota bacterium]